MTGKRIETMTLGVCGNAVAFREGRWWTHHSFGRIVDELAGRVGRIVYHAPETDVADACDHGFSAENVSVVSWGLRRNSLAALRHPGRLLGQYKEMVDRSDALFVRGSGPLLWSAHLMAAARGIPVVHWIVGNPLAIMKGASRGYGSVLQRAGVCFARLERLMTQWSVRAAGSGVLANGQELARIFASRRTRAVVSTSISVDDFRVRANTCTGPEIRLLFVGFVRPEKGLAYLIRAMPRIDSDRPVVLDIVGSWGQFGGEHERLCRLIDELKLTDRVFWRGYAPFGPALFERMDAADVLVLPSLSEGTPRVLIEARARSLPVVSTRVGGVPSSVTSGRDGLLVPPADADALAGAITRIVGDGAFRRGLIEQGRRRVRDWTVDRFADRVLEMLDGVEVGVGAT